MPCLIQIDYEGKTYTVCKFIQPYYVVGKKSGDKWEVITGDQVSDGITCCIDSRKLSDAHSSFTARP
eukprot:17581-Eustigmatos_ZCMA.PRE.1